MQQKFPVTIKYLANGDPEVLYNVMLFSVKGTQLVVGYL